MSYSLYLDDARYAPSGWVCVRSYKAFVGAIMAFGLPERISFDHDLGEVKTGLDCAKYLVEFCMEQDQKLPAWKVHSANPVGSQNIRSLLSNYQRHEQLPLENERPQADR